MDVENDVCEPKPVVVGLGHSDPLEIIESRWWRPTPEGYAAIGREELEAEIRAQDATIVRLVSENYELRQALRNRAVLREGQHVEHA